MNKTYKMIDILHTGHHGKRGERKIGKKYDNRRERIIRVNTEERGWYGGLIFKGIGGYQGLYTTEFVREYDEDRYHYIETINSIYKLEKIAN